MWKEKWNGNQNLCKWRCSCVTPLSQTTHSMEWSNVCGTCKQRTIEYIKQILLGRRPPVRHVLVGNWFLDILWINILKIYGLMFQCQWHIPHLSQGLFCIFGGSMTIETLCPEQRDDFHHFFKIICAKRNTIYFGWEIYLI